MIYLLGKKIAGESKSVDDRTPPSFLVLFFFVIMYMDIQQLTYTRYIPP
jgi:hypothetical protein